MTSKNQHPFNATLVVALASMIGLSAGCSALSEKKLRLNPFAKTAQESAEEVREVDSMAVIWKDSVLDSNNGKSIRGFGGRVFFYDAEHKAMKADGELVVYGFDDSGDGTKSGKADHKYVFERSDMAKHFSESDLGASYSFWIPWEPVGGTRKTITLIPVFKTATGRVVKGGQSINNLPGKAPDAGLQRTLLPREPASGSVKVLGSSPALVSQAVYDSASESTEATARQMTYESELATEQPRIRTSTFMLPPSVANRIAAAKPSSQSPLGNVTQRQIEESDLPTRARSAALTRQSKARSQKSEMMEAREQPQTDVDQSEKASSDLRQPGWRPGGTAFGKPGEF